MHTQSEELFTQSVGGQWKAPFRRPDSGGLRRPIFVTFQTPTKPTATSTVHSGRPGALRWEMGRGLHSCFLRRPFPLLNHTIRTCATTETCICFAPIEKKKNTHPTSQLAQLAFNTNTCELSIFFLSPLYFRLFKPGHYDNQHLAPPPPSINVCICCDGWHL